MKVEDKCCTIVPYFKVHEGQMEAFEELCRQFVVLARQEAKCLFYGFSFHGDIAHCREGYEDAQGVLVHFENVGELFQETLKIADLIRLEIHGNQEEIDQLREPLAEINPEFFILKYGFRN